MFMQFDANIFRLCELMPSLEMTDSRKYLVQLNKDIAYKWQGMDLKYKLLKFFGVLASLNLIDLVQVQGLYGCSIYSIL